MQKIQICILPILKKVIFPYQIIQIRIPGTYDFDSNKNSNLIGLVNKIEDDNENQLLKNDQYSLYGVLVKITQEESTFMPFEFNGLLPNKIQGKTYKGLAFARFKLETIIQKVPHIIAQVEIQTDEMTSKVEQELTKLNLINKLKNISCQYLEIMESRNDVLVKKQQLINDEKNINKLVFNMCQHVEATTLQKLLLLQMNDNLKRIRFLIELMQQKLEKLRLAKNLEQKVRKEIEGDTPKKKSDSNFPLSYSGRQESGELDELYKKIQECKLPPNINTEIMKEFKRLQLMQSQGSQEAVVSRTYIEFVVDLPWNTFTQEDNNLKNAETILNRDHFGLQKVKSRIIEYLAVRQLKGNAKGSIICLLGPPGVGKTSLGKSIADSLGRKFTRISLGGVRDDAEIRGHRRTYVGALPGVILQTIRKCKSKNPVILLDEIDKISQAKGIRGDPSSVLLEVLDPAQNDNFVDHYLGLPFDLSNVLFIVTANSTDTIQPPLLDRLEVISIPGYTFEEKLQIALKYLIPRLIVDNGLVKDIIEFDESAVEYIIKNYTSEPGVRSLSRQIGQVCRHVAVDYSIYKQENDLPKQSQNPFTKRVISIQSIKDILGVEVNYVEDIQQRITKPGIAIGLAWTPNGGKVLIIETSYGPGKGRVEITGQLGDVMKESVKTGIGWIRSTANKFEILKEIPQKSQDFFDKIDVHIHFPAAAIPKDGPSAGITITTALVSLLTGKKVRKDLAMTGEITLTGFVLPVGGIKEKCLAAFSEGITNVILPLKNKKDTEEINKEIRSKIKFYFVKTIEEVLGIALEQSSINKKNSDVTQIDIQNLVQKPKL